MIFSMRPALRRAGLALSLVATAQPGFARPARRPNDAAVQLLADVTLIDAQCRGVTVAFGTAFRMAAANGVEAADLMPGSPLRPLFEAAMLRRTLATPREQLCGALAFDYAAAVPGLVSRP